MVDTKFAGKVLGVFYDKWFTNYVIGVFHRELGTIVDADRNDVLKMIQTLEDQGMIRKDDVTYKISSYGIETYEEALPASKSNKRITQRKHILEILKEVYDDDINKGIDDKQLTSKLGVDNDDELRAQLKYLDDKGLIKYNSFMGGTFLVQLTASGDITFDTSFDHDESVPMTNAYKILFKLENHLRNFIEKKLIESFGVNYWTDGISQGIRDKVDKFKTEESVYPWKISVTKSNMEYLRFPDLLRIIKNKQEIFQPIFSDIAQIELRLNELENIRNAIAHTRTLSEESITRLEQYDQDLLNLTS